MTNPTHTLLYYTASLLPVAFADRIRASLIISSRGKYPIVSVSQRPLTSPFGHNVCVGNIGSSIFNCYSQILNGTCHITTPYVVCCEDDALYSPEHLDFIPPRDDTFYYNHSRYSVDPTLYWRRPNRTIMGMCVCSTVLLRRTLTERFSKYPHSRDSVIRYFAEPGKYEAAMGLPVVPLEPFRTTHASLTFNHRPSLGGARKLQPTDESTSTLPYWGDASVLWDLYAPHTNAPKCTRDHDDGGYITRLAVD